jgi:hypothetical protein
MAAPVSGAKLPAADPAGSLVQKVHGCHRQTERGYRGWHRHSRRSCRRISVGPRRHYRGPRRRGPVCVQRCQYIGPIKTCERVCR